MSCGEISVGAGGGLIVVVNENVFENELDPCAFAAFTRQKYCLVPSNAVGVKDVPVIPVRKTLSTEKSAAVDISNP